MRANGSPAIGLASAYPPQGQDHQTVPLPQTTSATLPLDGIVESIERPLIAHLRPVASSGTMKKLFQIGSRIAFALTVFLVLATAILTRPPKPLDEFDQPFYLT